MQGLTASLPKDALRQLETLGQPSTPPIQVPTEVKTNTHIEPLPSIGESILEAYEVAIAYAKQIQEVDIKRSVEQKLSRSNVRGSLVVGIKGPEDVARMLSKVTNWMEVIANLKDKDITVFQGELSEDYSAVAAYASVREIDYMFGSSGLGSIQIKKGYQQEDDYYFCTMLRFPTRVITVQLKQDGGQEQLHQWFAGPEVSSIGRFNDGDTVVRCGVVIPPIAEQYLKKARKRDNFRQNGRAHRAG